MKVWDYLQNNYIARVFFFNVQIPTSNAICLSPDVMERRWLVVFFQMLCLAKTSK